MLTKGHDFPDVTLVVVLNADQGLFGADFRASERLAQQIVQVAGRAGRGDRPGEVLIQTSYPEHPLLKCLITEGYEGFAALALEERRAAGWPPFSHLALLRADSPARAEAFDFLQRGRGRGARPPRRPASGSSAPRPPRWRGAPAVTARSSSWSRRHAGRCRPSSPPGSPAIAAQKAPRQLRWSLDVDPAEVD